MLPNRDLSLVPAAVLSQVNHILDIEGGYTDDKADKGGATNHGVSLRYARDIGLDLDGDGDVDGQDILLVSVPIARQLFLEDFFYKRGVAFDRLPAAIQGFQFDFAVNSGAGRAVIELQDVIAQIRLVAPDLGLPALASDGMNGPKTQAAAARCLAALGGHFVNALVENRIAFLKGLVAHDPSQARFINGWVARCNGYRLVAP